MPDFLSEALATPGLGWLMGAVFVAGVVRGFSGFGSAMIIMSVASSFLSPIAAITFLVLAEIPGPLPNLPSAMRNGRPKDAGRLLIGAALALPIGLWCASQIEPRAFSWMITAVVTGLLLISIWGWRYHGQITSGLTTVVGGLGGFTGGIAGIPGPPVIMFYISTPLPAMTIRANLLLYLLGIDLLFVPVLYLMGHLYVPAIVLGLLAAVPNVIGNILGARLFDPQAEKRFRTIAYLVIAASVIVGLPIWKT
jgi:uncharacterized membrane protein YfcA